MKKRSQILTQRSEPSPSSRFFAKIPDVIFLQTSPPRVDFVFRFRYRLRCLFEISEKNSAVGTYFFLSIKNDRKLREDTCIFICTNLKSIMGWFRVNNTVANFWMLFATLSAYVVLALEVDREALAHVACAQIFLESATVASWLSYHRNKSSASLISEEL